VHGYLQVETVAGGCIFTTARAERYTKFAIIWREKDDPYKSCTWEPVVASATSHLPPSVVHSLCATQAKAFAAEVQGLREGLVGQEIVVPWRDEFVAELKKMFSGSLAVALCVSSLGCV